MTDYYVRPTNGLDTNAGTSFGAAFKTLQKALDTVAAGDKVLCCAEATETTSVAIDVDTTNGTLGSPITIEGRDGTDGSTAATYTIQASSTITTKGLLHFTLGNYYHFSNIVLDANSNADYAAGSENTDTQAYLSWYRCHFKNSSADGYQVRTSNGTVSDFEECEFFDNAGMGLDIISVRGTVSCNACKFYDNGGFGARAYDDQCEFNHCLFYGNGSDGLNVQSNGDVLRVRYCTFYNNTSNGILLSNSTVSHVTVTHSSFSLNGAYGINWGTGNAAEALIAARNHFYNNTSGDQASATGLFPTSPGNISGDPKFTNTTAGSEDFSLQATSPLFQAGSFNTNIGAMGLASAGGGGGMLIHPGMRGGING